MKIPEHCDRCRARTNITTMSWFNTDVICLECSEAEKAHPDYDKARDAEEAAVRSGNLNFAGVGLPEELRVKPNEPT